MSLFKRKFKSFLVDGKYKIVEAFTFKGKRYFCFDSAIGMSAGRGLNAMVFFKEFEMQCDKSYLQAHTKAMEKLLSDPKKINIGAIALINQNLKERVNLAVMPEHLYKLASVHFWTEDESPFVYDFELNKKKIEEWKKDPEVLSFFLTRPLKEYLPFSDTPSDSVETYLKVADQIDKMTRTVLSDMLSKKE
jgi:hypothetical protein